MTGKRIRLGRILDRRTGRAVIVPMDHGFSQGQIEGLRDMGRTIASVCEGGADAIVLHKGMIREGLLPDLGRTALVVHLSGSTALSADPDHKVIVGTVEEAVALGADAVSVHVNLGAAGESRMIADAGKISADCSRSGMPLLVMIYPRGKGIDPVSPAAVGHCVRVAEELGADLIKTNYTGDPASFGRIAGACQVPVLVAGGERSGDAGTLAAIRDAVTAGGAGVCAGRNVFQRDEPGAFVRALRAVVHDGMSPADALQRAAHPGRTARRSPASPGRDGSRGGRYPVAPVPAR